MSVLRQLNVLGQQRLDVPHIRSIESSIAADFDVLAGRVQAGGKPLVIRGFTLANFTAGQPASSIQLSTADGILYNMNSSESGTFLWVPADRAVEVLNSSTNARVEGGFTAGQINYIGLDLVRTADDTTSDLVQFLDPNTLLEQAKNVPLARTLDYKIIISTTPFSASSNIIPIAKVKTDNQNQVDTAVNAVEDARNLMWRLGSGGDFPALYNSFTWSQGRFEYDPNVGALSTLDKFGGGDKGITSQKDWMDAVMMRLWEIGGGQNWYSPTADRNVKMIKQPAAVFSSTGDNFEHVNGLYSSLHLHWQGLRLVFENANVTGVYYNTVQDQLSDDAAGSAALSKTALAIGDCIYVDIDRTSNATVTAKKAAIQTLGVPAIPGSRIILAWRDASGAVFSRDNSFPVNTSFTPATITTSGSTRLSRDYTGAVNNPIGSASSPVVISEVGGIIQSIAANQFGLQVTATGNAVGIIGVGGSNSGHGGQFTGGATNGSGVLGIGSGTGTGGYFRGATAGSAPAFDAQGLVAKGSVGKIGASIVGGDTDGLGLQVVGGSGNGPGTTITVTGSGRGLDISAATGQGARIASTGSGAGVQINKTGSGAGLDIQAGSGSGYGLFIQGNGSAVTMAINSAQAQWADFQGGSGDGFTLPGGYAARFQGGSALSNPVSGSMAGGDGLRSFGGQGFGHNGTAFNGGPGGISIVGTGGKGGDIIAGGTGTAGDGGDGANFFGGNGGDNISSAAGGAGGRGLYVKGGTGGTSTSGPEGAGGIGMTLIGGDGNNASNPGVGLNVFGGSGGSGNANAIEATPTGTGRALDANTRIRVKGSSTSQVGIFSPNTTGGSVISSVRPLLITSDFTNLNEAFPYTPGFSSNILISGGGSNTGGSGAVQLLNQTTNAGFSYALEVMQWNGASYSQSANIDSNGRGRFTGGVNGTTSQNVIGGDFSSGNTFAVQATGNASAAALRAVGGTNQPAISATGGGNGAGVSATGGSGGGAGGVFTGGTGSGTGIVVTNGSGGLAGVFTGRTTMTQASGNVLTVSGPGSFGTTSASLVVTGSTTAIYCSAGQALHCVGSVQMDNNLQVNAGSEFGAGGGSVRLRANNNGNIASMCMGGARDPVGWAEGDFWFGSSNNLTGGGTTWRWCIAIAGNVYRWNVDSILPIL